MRRIAALALFLIALACPALHADGMKPRVIVFVHGLHGDKDTWRNANGAYWPQMVATDPHFQLSDVVVAEYPTPSTHGQYSTQQLAQLLYQQLQQKGVWQHNEVVFIAHSLGGLLTEEMLLSHPDAAAKVRFIVSYSTPHQGSFVANLAKIYDSDPLLTDLRSSNDNGFLMDLEQQWRSTPSVTRVHRYCAYETLDTAAGAGIGMYLRAHTRVVDYYSATYGCDTDTPPQKIVADHIDIVKPPSRFSAAYTFFAQVYHNNPVLSTVDTVRDNKISGLTVACNRSNENSDLQVPVALDPTLHEQLMSAQAEFVDKDKIKTEAPPSITRLDPIGIAHISYSFKGQGRGLLLECPTGRTSILVHFDIRSQVPTPE